MVSDNQRAYAKPTNEVPTELQDARAIAKQADPVIIPAAAVSTRKRGKCMTRRRGQNPKLEIRNGLYTFRYRQDVAGVEKRKQVREVLGPVRSMTKSEAQRRIKEFMVNSEINIGAAKIPSVLTFADAVKFYRDVFAPRALRASTFDVADIHIRRHLEPDWKDVPIDHIDIDAVNEWSWKKRREGLSWTMIKNVLRTMQRVLSCRSKDKKPPFSLSGLEIPERDKLRMRIKSRKATSFSWADCKRIVEAVRKLDSLDESRKNMYATAFLLASATALRCGELFALRVDDIDFQAGTIQIDESVDRLYAVGECKNTAAYRTVVITDSEGWEALRAVESLLGEGPRSPNALIFRARSGAPLRLTNVLHDGLHPALAAVGLPKTGMHAFRRGCNRRWELARMNPAVLRQMMGHSSASMTERYTGEIPIEQVRIVTNCDQKQFEAVA